MAEQTESAVLYKNSDRLMNSNLHMTVKWTNLLLLVGFMTTFGISVPVGYNIGVINAPAEYMKNWCNQSIIERYDVFLTSNELETLWSSIVSIFLIGGCIGSLCGAWIADKLGRKRSVLSCGVLFLIGALLFITCRVANSVEMLVIGRLLVGLASGLTTSTIPMYLTELAPLALRGTLGVLCSMGVTGGVVVGQIFSLQQIFGNEAEWHFALSFYAVLVIVSLLPYPWYPESPKYLYCIVGDKNRSIYELNRLSASDQRVVQYEVDMMESSLLYQTEKRSLWSVIKDPALLLPLVIVCVLQGGQQLSGINAVFYYSVSIFQIAGLSPDNAKWANLGAGCINLFIAFFSPVLMARVNRRPLIFLSCLVSSIFLFLLTIIVNKVQTVSWLPYACIVAVFGYILFYQLGLGPIPYFIGSELFDVAPRPAAMSIGSLASWTGNFIVGMTFPALQTAWGAFVFLPFAFVCLILAIFLKIYLPETRGKHITDVTPLVANGFRSKPLSPSNSIPTSSF